MSNPTMNEIEQGIREVEVAARALLPTMVWINQDGEPFHVGWEGASAGQRDSARDTAAEILEAINFDAPAVVRRGVESGTIKGFSVESQHDHVWGESLPAVRGVEPGTYLLVGPVSDGGSET